VSRYEVVFSARALESVDTLRRNQQRTRHDPADVLKTLFRDIFGCRGRDFGSPSRGVLGISDGNEGVQMERRPPPR